MRWMKVLSFFFDLIGAFFLIAAVIVFSLGAAVGGSAGGDPSNGATVAAFMGGMVGTMAAAANFLAALGMFFFGAVLWALQAILAELQQRGAGHL